MTNFDKTWARQETQSVTGKIRDAVKPQGALKPRIQNAVNKLQVQVSKMDTMLTKLRERDQQIFKRIVAAMQQHDTSTSKVLSNELAEIRKVSRMLGNARMSLEQVQLRLTTIHDLGDAMVAIGPAMSTMKGLKSSLGRFMPEADTELNSIRDRQDPTRGICSSRATNWRQIPIRAITRRTFVTNNSIYNKFYLRVD